MFTAAGKSISGHSHAGVGVGVGGVHLSRREMTNSHGGPVLNSFGQVIVNDPTFAHHNMSLKTLKDAKFSPGLGQADQSSYSSSNGSTSSRRLNSLNDFSNKNPNIQAFLRRDKYVDNHRPMANDDDDDDDDGDELAQARRSRRADAAAHTPIQATPQSTFRPFDPKTDVVSPRVPLAADASLHKPGGGEVKIFSQKLDLSHVQSKIPRGLTHTPKPSEVSIWNDRRTSASKYDHIKPKVPTADSAANYRPSGGNVTVLHRKLNWHSETTLPVTAAEASKYQPAKSEPKPIFHERLDFSHATPTVPSASDAAKYKKHGGELDVFVWKKSPETRRQPPAKKSEIQILEEYFPGREKTEEKQMQVTPSVQTNSSSVPYASRRRRDLLLKTD